MKPYLIKIPRIITSYYKNYTWRFKTIKKEIYLTFDDGPTTEVTQFVLDTLKEHQAKATFFCIGKNIEKHPELFKKIIKEGHAIGNHTQHHLNGWKTSLDNYINDIETCQNTINQFTKNSKLFRPAYGRIKKSQAKSLINKGYQIIMWSVLSGDFDTHLSKEKCLDNVVKNTKNGDIIVFHDSEKAFEKLQYLLPLILKYFSEKGFEFMGINS